MRENRCSRTVGGGSVGSEGRTDRRPPSHSDHNGDIAGIEGDEVGVQAAVIYYSATGSVYAMARAVVTGAEKAGAETRLRKVRELAPDEAVAANEGWQAHALDTQAIEEASLDDLEWADVVIIGTPTRYGNVAAQVKQFIDTTGPLWAAGKLANKVYAGFVSTGTAHGGQESTLLALANTFYHWGGIIVPPGYIDPIQFVAGNPYGASHISANGANPPGETDLAAAEFTGRRAVEIASALRTGGMREIP
jgi:NAD(P)H dehydrogenase (quinone)